MSSSRFLGGSLLVDSVDLDSIASLDGTESSNSGTPTPDTDTATLDLSAVQALQVEVPGGLTLGVLGSLLQVGAVNHYSQASDNGISRAASGAVSNAGAVDTTGSGSFPANAEVSLTPLLGGPVLGGVIDQLDISAGAITGVAALDAALGTPATSCSDLSAPTHCRDYNVADLDLTLSSPAVAAIAELLTGPGGVAETVDASLDGLVGSNGALAQALDGLINTPALNLLGNAGVDISITSDVTGALDAVLDAPLTDGVVSVDLRTGAIEVDINQLLIDETGAGINDLAPNTEVLTPALLTALANRVDALLATVSTLVETAVTAALNAAVLDVNVSICPLSCGILGLSINVDGTLAEVLDGTAVATVSLTVATLDVPISVSALLGALATPIEATLFNATTGVVATTTAGLVSSITSQSTLVHAALEAIPSIVSLQANVQEAGSTAGSFREVALRLTLIDIIGPGGVGTIDLGRAEVGRNTVAPTQSSMTPVQGPDAGGTSVTITGTGFMPGETTVYVDGDAVTPTAVTATSVTFTTPVHVAEAVEVITETPGGTTDPLTFTYLPAPTQSSMTPVQGPDAGGTSVTITGTGFMPGETTVYVDGDAVTPTAVTSTSVTFTTPAHVAEGVEVQTETPGGLSGPLTYTYLPAPTLSAMTPNSGPVAGGTSVTITGTGFVPGETTVYVDGDEVTPTAVTSTSVTFTTPAHAAGDVDVTTETPGGMSGPSTYTYLPVPVQSAMTPNSGPIAGGTSVTITGTGFVPGDTTVYVDGDPVTPTAVTSTSVTFTTPAHVAGPVDVTTETPGGLSGPSTYTYLPVPTQSSMTPVQGPDAGGTSVTILGTGFVPGATTVYVDGDAVAPAIVTSSSVTFVTPAHVAEGVEVQTETPGGLSGPLDFTYLPAPTQASMTPDSGPVAGGTSVTIAGTGFMPGETTVYVDGDAVAPTAVTSTSVTFTTPAHVAGPVDVTTETPGGLSGPLTYTYLPVPTQTSLSPTHGPISGGTSVTITGTGFVPGDTTVYVDGDAVTPSAVTSTSVTFTTPAHVAGPVDVTTETSGGVSDPLTYTYDLAPNIASLTPDSGPTAGGQTVTIVGSGFEAGQTSVTIGGIMIPTAAVTVTSPTSLTFTTPAHALGAVDVTATTPGGTSDPLTYTYLPVPTQSSMTPVQGPDAGGTSVTITGTGFVPGDTTVYVDGDAVTPTAVTSTSVTFVTPAHVAEGVEVQTETPGGLSGPLDFTYLPAPTQSSMTPVQGPDAGGTSVTITGTDFMPGETTVYVDGDAVTPTAVTSTSVTFTTPAHAAGPVEVQTETPGGLSGPLDFTYLPAPTQSAMTPDSGPIAGGTSVTITGTGFMPGETTVYVDGDAVTPTAVTSTSVTFTTPAHVAGPVDVTTETPGGLSGPLTYTYLPVPTQTSLSPTHGPISGGTSVTITGTGFVPGDTTVYVDGDAVTPTAVTSTSVTFATPAHVAGPVDVTTETSGGVSDPLTYTYDLAPNIASLTPDSGPTAGGQTVTIVGSGFDVGNTVVQVDGVDVPAGDITDVTLTSLTFVTPAHAIGPVDVTVITPGGTSDPLEYTYVAVPTITELSPDRGPLGGNQVITATGTGFIVGATSIVVDGVTLPAIATSETSLTFVNPAHIAGPVDVTAVTAGGESEPATYTYDAQPTVDGLSPNRDVVTGGAIVSVTGTGFVAGQTSITVDGISVPVEVSSGTTATFVAPAHPAGVVDVIVTTPGGSSSPRPFTYLSVPGIIGMDVSSGPTAGGTTVTITGSGFMPGETSVEIGGGIVGPDDVRVADAGTTITFVTPAHTPGPVSVTVRTPGGISPEFGYTYVAPAPTAPSGGLPATGFGGPGMVIPAMLLLAIGAALVAMSTNRRRDLITVVSSDRSNGSAR